MFLQLYLQLCASDALSYGSNKRLVVTLVASEVDEGAEGGEGGFGCSPACWTVFQIVHSVVVFFIITIRVMLLLSLLLFS